MFTVLDYFEKTVAHFPEHIVCEDRSVSMTYQQFASEAKAIGSYLCRSNETHRPVAVLTENTPQSWAAMIGAVYSGNFYVPVDAQTPFERLKSICNTLEPVAVIVDEKTRAKGEQLEGVTVFLYDEIVKTEKDDKLLNAIRSAMVDCDPVIALFTSGSTGTPKGPVISHASIISYMEWFTETFHVNESTIFGSQSPFFFGISISTMFATLFSGATLVVIPKQMFSFPIELLQFMNEKKVSMIYWVASALKSVANYKALDKISLPNLKTILFAGEVMPVKQFNYWRAHMAEDTVFGNLYGPTEAIDTVTCYIVDREFRDNEVLPLGHACDNCGLMVLRPDDTLIVEPDEEGELCIRGAYLALGYYNDPEKTNEVFTQNPLNSSYPERIYRTGDIVKYNARGELVYVSRKDFQIKHQGYRIELGEIEAAVGAIKSVLECVCFYDTDNEFIVLCCSGEGLTPKLILQGVRDRLPKYMMPNKFIFLPALPHNANGKIDRKRLKQRYEESKG